MDVWARPSREGVGNGEPWIKARVTPVLVIEMSRKSLGGWRAKYSRGWQKDVSAQGDGEPHVLGTAVATFCQKMGQSGKRTKHAPLIRLIRLLRIPVCVACKVWRAKAVQPRPRRGARAPPGTWAGRPGRGPGGVDTLVIRL